MITATAKIGMYRQMLLIRRIEERVAEMYGEQQIGGFTHLYIGGGRDQRPQSR
jgi:pyruvate dehydrogenase E1 component alpha subunit